MTSGMYFVAIQGTYHHLELALFHNETCLAQVATDQQRASSFLITMLDELLQTHQRTLADLSFLAVDIGPGAFTSLRVVLATVNGIAFAKKIPLLGVNSLDALAYQVASPATLVLLNAYNNDVYAGYYRDGMPVWRVCKKIDAVLAELSHAHGDPSTSLGRNAQGSSLPARRSLGEAWVEPFERTVLTIVGNAVPLHIDLLTNLIVAHTIQPVVLPSAITIGTLAWQQWLAGERGVLKLEPCYMKSQAFAITKPT